MHKVYTIFILLWMPIGIFSAQLDDTLQGQVKRFSDAQRVWNASAMESARAGFATMSRAAPGEYTPLYWQSVSEFYLMLCYGLEDSSGFDSQKADELIDEAEQTMKAAIKIRPEEAECHAMLSSVYGFRIVKNPVSAVWNGPKVLSLQHTALENEPSNPRMLYIIGAGYFRAPKLLRNVDKALGFLKEAEASFENLSAEDPQWGRAECYGLLGDLYLERGDSSLASTYYNQALRINPAYVPAQRGLKEIKNEK